MQSEYELDDVHLLSQIRDDILKHPNAYLAGAAFLQEQYGPDRLRRDAFAEWEQFKDHPTQLASQQDTAQHVSRGIANSAQREAREREIIEQLSAPPDPKRWSLAACACKATQGLSDGMAEAHHDTKAQAILLLAVMLWDADADKRNPIFTLFGPWGTTPAGEVVSISRWAAAYFLSKPPGLRQWMDTVRKAWVALPRAEGGQADKQVSNALNDDRGYCAASDIAKKIGAPDKVDAIRMRLKRLLDANLLPDNAWMENGNPARGHARLLYNLQAVRPFLSKYER